MATNQKDTIYIDIDDDITTIIDKITASKERIVALVLPKRATVLQSIVNMKLLKRAAENAKKHVVLITSESGILPLAGAVGMYVAPSLQSKPIIPPAPDGVAAPDTAADTDLADDFEPEAAAATPVGQLAGPAAFADRDEVETITLDNDEPEDADAAKEATAGLGAAGAAATAAKVKKNSKLKVPDFNKFRLLAVGGGAALIALLVFLYFANFVLPKAAVTIQTDSSDIPTNANVTLDPTAQELDVEGGVLPAKIATKQQSGSQQAAATGQKNKGTKAIGEVTMTTQVCGSISLPNDVPAGTGVSSGGKTFITQQSTSFSPSGKPSGGCQPFKADDVTPVTAQSAGASFNIAPATFAVASRSEVTAKSSEAMSGGTDNIVKVVSQADIDGVKQKITSQDSGSVKNTLKNSLQSDGYLPVANSLQAGDPTVTTSASVGDEADTVTVTSVTTYSMYGVKKSDIEDFIMANVKDKINPSKQKILSLGADRPIFDITSPASSGPLQVSLSATTLAGPDIKTDALKTQIKGKKTNDVRTIAKATPGVTDVLVRYSPFWVSKVPKNESKITIVIEKAPATANGTKP